MKHTRAVIVTNGTLSSSFVSDIRLDDYVIGVDKAAYWLLTQGIVPNVAVGDFDSTSETEFKRIKHDIADIRTFPPEKDFVDTELAVTVALEKKVSEIVIYGGAGTRMDHTLATLSLLELGIKHKISIVFRTETNEIRLISRGRTIVKKRGEFIYFSVIPYTKKIIISLEGLKFPLEHATIHRGQTIGVSNEFMTDRATVTMYSGIALIIQSRD